MGKLKKFFIDLRSSLWFVPSLLVLGAAGLALALIGADQEFDRELKEWWPRLFGAEAEGARAMLSAIAGSTITITGVVFSIVIVALALASTQYTSRVLRNFMRDRANQTVLGVFLGIYTYCLLVLRTISSGNGARQVPALAVFMGVILALIGIGFLIFFIHHIAATIQASEIIAAITHETTEAVDRLFPQELGEEADEEDEPAPPLPQQQKWYAIPAQRNGYIQTVEMDGLLRFARERNVVLKMEREIGEFVAKGRPLAALTLPAEPDEATIKQLNALYGLGNYRTVAQDAPFGIRQLVDIALKALSPGINDTSTAVICVDHLSAILLRLATRRPESPYRYDEGALRVIAKGPTFAEMLNLAFNQIRENGEENPAVLLAILNALREVAEVTRNARRRRALLEQAQLIAEAARRKLESPQARRRVEERLEEVCQALDSPLPAPYELAAVEG